MISGYTITEQLTHGDVVAVHRAVRSVDGKRVVVKSLLSDTATYQNKARLRYEYKLLQMLAQAQVKNVLVPLDLLEENGVLCMVSEDIGGESLARVQRAKALTLRETLYVGEQVAHALMGIHQLRVIHKDINPNNLVYNRETGKVQVIDFGISTKIPLELQAVDNLRQLEGTLAYISPEQTGRMNRLLDYRTDFYSLGASLYQLLSGVTPFPIDDISKLVHAILAKVPPSLVQIAPRVPVVVTQMVERLLQKVPEDRYQSAFGVQRDLARCLEALDNTGQVGMFPICTDDRNETFAIPQKLYGRAEDVDKLLTAYARVVGGQREMLLVAGPSGIGKSALVNQIQPGVVEHNGLYISGKFDQLRRHVPFNALSQALASLVRRVLMEPEEMLDSWRRRVQVALGNIGQALIDIVPSLELLVGKQKPIPELGPRETEDRLLLLFQRLMLALCSKQPLVLFLDDLQWADLGTFKLLKLLAADDRPMAGLLVVGAYRDGEVGPDHPLRGTIDEVRTRKMRLEQISVAPMSAASVLELVADTTHAAPHMATPLAHLVLQKTAGNPFFVREFLNHLWRMRLLRYDANASRWMWNLESITAAAVTDNVVELMATKLGSLAPDEHGLLSMAACLGNEFKLSALCAVTEKSREATLTALAPATQYGLLVTMGNHRYASETQDDVVFKFAHDRIQQAAHEMLSPDQRVRNHYAIGQRLLATHDPRRPEEWVFAVVDHFNKALSVVTDPAELVRMAKLNVVAAKEAKRSAAYGIAIDYLSYVKKQLGAHGWEQEYAVMRQAALELVDNQFLLGNADAADRQIEETLKFSRTDTERAEVQCRRVLCMMALSQYPNALKSGIEALRLLNFDLPLHPRPWQVRLELGRIELARRNRPIERLAMAPTLTDKHIVQVMEALSNMVLPAFFSNTPLLHMVVLSMGRLTILHGNSPFSVYAFSSLSLIYSQLNEFERARRYAIATRNAIERLHGSVQVSSSLYFINAFIEFARTAPRSQTELFDELYDRHIESGDPLFAGLTAFSDLRGLVTVSVDETLEKHSKYANFVDTKGSPQLRSWVRSTRQAALCLAGRTRTPLVFTDDVFDEVKEEEFINSGNAGAAGQMYYYYKTLTLVIHGDAEGACAAAHLATTKYSIFQKAAAQTVAPFSFYAALAMVMQAAMQGQKSVTDTQVFKPAMAKVRLLAAEGRDIYGGMPFLIEAEIAALAGKERQAEALYHKAINLLARSGYPAYYAMALERAGRFHARHDNESLARAFLSQARDAYFAWGARIKTAMLEKEFAGYTTSHGARNMYDRTGGKSTRGSNTGVGLGGNVELPALLRVTQALAGEVHLDRLVAKIMDNMVESAGATRGVLLLDNRDGLQIIADSADSAGSPGDYPREVVQYTQRAREPVVIDNAAENGSFRGDAYVMHAQPKSLLCAPIMHQGKVQGVIYLENTVTSGAFTDDRLLLVKLLAAQAATSLENSRAYAQLEERVAIRSSELEEAHNKLLRMERENTEQQLAGGFAHEMRNALTSARFVLSSAFPVEVGMEEVPTLYELDKEDLAALRGLLDQPGDMVRQRLAELLPGMDDRLDMVRDSLETVLQCLQRGLRITGQILEYSQVGHLQAGDDVVRINTVVDTIMREYTEQFDIKGIEASADVQEELSFPIREDHVYAIVRNLVDNACDALQSMPAGSRRIVLRASRDVSGVALVVHDNGPGIAKANQGRIFQPFFTTKGTDGTGLGLGLSRKLARIYGGDLGFTSEEALGTEFKLLLPARRAQEGGK